MIDVMGTPVSQTLSNAPTCPYSLKLYHTITTLSDIELALE
jgi:hypothetical protein